MVATSTSSFRQSAAVAVIAGAAVLASFGVAKGQQLAATDLTPDRQTYIETHCGPLAKASLECVTLRSTEFTRAQTAAAKKQIDAADKVTLGATQRLTEAERLQRCGEFLRGKRDREGVVFNRKITRDNMCPYAIELGMRDGPG